MSDSFFSTIQKNLLGKQVLAGIPRNGKFRENDYLHPTLFRLFYKFFCFFYIEFSVGHFHSWYCRSHCNKTFFHIFSLTVSRDITNVGELLEYSYARYKEDTYKEKFAWIDNIKYVEDKAKIDILNRQLVNEIRSCNFDKIWMAVPEVVSWEDIIDFKISGIKETYDDIYIDIVVDSLRNELIDVAQMKCKRI